MKYDFKNVWSQPNIACLEITTFRGISNAAMHYYGTLHWRNPHTAEHERIEIEYEMTAEQAKEFNELEDVDHYEKGWDSKRFNDLDHLYRITGMRVADNEDIWIVLDKSPSWMECSRIVYCKDTTLIEPVNELYRAYEEWLSQDKDNEEDWDEREIYTRKFEDLIKLLTNPIRK